jgi:hypothetical protein
LPTFPPPPSLSAGDPLSHALPPVRGTRHAPPPLREVDDRPPRWPWFALGIGLAFVPSLFLPRGFTWFLCAIPHEMGHATMGCLLGHPSAPAISLQGEAWAGIGEMRPWLVWFMALAAGAGAAAAWRTSRLAAVALGVLAVASPSIAWTTFADVLIAAAGHLGELAFAAYCYSLCWTGGRTDTPQERTACALAGALIQVANLRLFFGLCTDGGARAFYATNGSLGLKNDLLVLAEDLCQCRLQSVAALMLVIALLALPAGLAIGWWRDRVQSL